MGSHVSTLPQGKGRMLKAIRGRGNLLEREEGAALAEYALLVAFIALVCVGAITLLGTQLPGPFNTLADAI